MRNKSHYDWIFHRKSLKNIDGEGILRNWKSLPSPIASWLTKTSSCSLPFPIERWRPGPLIFVTHFFWPEMWVWKLCLKCVFPQTDLKLWLSKLTQIWVIWATLSDKRSEKFKKGQKNFEGQSKGRMCKNLKFSHFFCFLGSIRSKNLCARIFLVFKAIKDKKAKQRPQHRKYVIL